MTDLAREIAGLPFLGCYCGLAREHLWHCPSLLRPAILAFITRKLDEAHADSELLGKVEAKLWEVGGIDLIETDNGQIVAATGEPGPGYREAPTLREALHKLVGGGE